MALPRQHIVINLGQGVDSKTDPKLVAPGKLLRLINGVFKKKGRIDKRNGYDLISSKTVSDETLEDASALQTFNNELLQYNKQKLYSYSEGSEKWIDKGAVVSASVETKQIVKNTASQTQVDFATNNGISLYAYEDSRGGVRATVYDEESGTAMLSDTVVAASGTRVRVVSFSTYLYVFYYNAGNLYARRINPQSPTAFESAVTLVTDVNTTDPHYDVLPYQNLRMAFAYNRQGATEISFGWLSDAPAVLTGTLAAQTISEAASNCLSIVLGPSNLFYVAWHNASGLRATIRNNGGTEIVAPTTVDSYTSTAIRNITGFAARNNSGLTFFYELSAAAAQNQLVRKNTLSTTGTVGTESTFLRSVGLWSKAWSYYFDSETTDHGYVCVTHSSTLQSTYFIARDDGVIVGKIQYSLGAGLQTRTILANVQALSSDTYAFAVLNKFQLVSENNNVFSLQGVSQSRINFDASEQFNSLQLGNNLHIAGGILNMYDGQSVVEHGFHLFPEYLSGSQSGAAGVADGTYNYIAVYEWTDNFGQIHRSAPSTPYSFTVSGGPRNVSIVVDSLRLTQKISPRSEVSIALYRTEEGPGEIYYRTSSITSPSYNSTSADTVTIVDTTADATLISSEILYTTGGVLENLAPPSCKFIEQYKDRIFLSGLEDPNQIWYSKVPASGEPVEFNASLTIDCSSEGGGIRGLATLDDKEVIFKKDRFFLTYGDGPNNAGGGSLFAKPEFITADVGLETFNSVVRTPVGIMFKSEKGIYLLDSSLNTNYIGADVEEFNGEEITSATLLAENNQVRFTTRSGPALVYDYFVGQWSTFSPYSALDSLIYDKTFVFISKNGTVYRESSTGFKDAGKGISLGIMTGWIALDSIVGMQRVYKLIIIGEYKSYHKLKVSIGYDFSESFLTEYVMDTDDALGITTFGSESPFGNEDTFGGRSRAYRFEFGMDIQKCTAIRIKIEDLTVSSTPGTGEAFNITALGLEVGVKGQTGKYRSEQKIASN